MACIPEAIILNIVRGGSTETRRPFTLTDLLGDTITGNRSVDLQANQQGHVYPGRYLEILDFASGKALAWYEEGHEDSSTTHAYLIAPDGTAHYREDLFNPDRQRPH